MRTVVLDSEHAGLGFGTYMPGLIETLGTPKFGTELFSAVREVFDCVHFTALSTPRKIPAPQTLYARSLCGTGIANMAAGRYLEQWHHDPVVRPLIGSSARESCELLIQPTREEFAGASYRRHCYDPDGWIDHGASIVDRISLVRIDEARILFLNFYRNQTSGAFKSNEIKELKAASGFLFALIARQRAQGSGFHTARSISEALPYVEAALPDVPKRESQVCAGIAIGMNSEGIALELGITVNTVLTYRKRVYSRLGISSQNELVKLVIPSDSTSLPH